MAKAKLRVDKNIVAKREFCLAGCIGYAFENLGDYTQQ